MGAILIGESNHNRNIHPRSITNVSRRRHILRSVDIVKSRKAPGRVLGVFPKFFLSRKEFESMKVIMLHNAQLYSKEADNRMRTVQNQFETLRRQNEDLTFLLRFFLGIDEDAHKKAIEIASRFP